MALPSPPDGLDLGESRVREVTSALASTWALAVIAVSLRFLARRLKQNRIWWEDWIIVVSLVASSVHVFTTLGFMIPNGTGKHVWVGPAVATKAWAIGLFISEVAYTITLSTVKWSTLLFYWRIFSARQSIKIPIWILAGMVSAWCIAVLLVTIFQCVPTHAFWARYDPVSPMSPTEFYCGVNVNMFFNGNSIPNIITDACVVALPIPYVLSLQLRRSQKFALVGVFLLGAFVTAISIVRLHMILSVDLASPDITWNFCDSIIWTNVEANIAIVCACLPSLKPLLALAVSGTMKSTGASGNERSGGSYMLSDKTQSGAARSSSYLSSIVTSHTTVKGSCPNHGNSYLGSITTSHTTVKGSCPKDGNSYLGSLGSSHTTVKGSCPKDGNSYLGSLGASHITVKGSCPNNKQEDERPFTQLSERESNSSLEEARDRPDFERKPVILISTDFEVQSVSHRP